MTIVAAATIGSPIFIILYALTLFLFPNLFVFLDSTPTFDCLIMNACIGCNLFGSR